MDDVDQLIVPSDLSQALAEHALADGFFKNFNASSKPNALRYVKLAKAEPIRKKRIAKVVKHSARGEKLLQT